jgi:hypothetical protein
MSRLPLSIEEHEEPSLLYLTRESSAAPVMLNVVEKRGKDAVTMRYPINDARLLQMIADGANFLATRPRG